MDLERRVLAFDGVLRGRMEVILHQLEVFAVDIERHGYVVGDLYGVPIIDEIHDRGALVQAQDVRPELALERFARD